MRLRYALAFMRTIQLGGGKVPRNPRLFSKRIRRADNGIAPGELVAVRDMDGGFVARAFYSPASVIAAPCSNNTGARW